MHKNIPAVIGITILFLGVGVQPAIAIDNVKESYIPISNGNILYVGGSGEGNYTKIQDAINDANHGDTIFVYDDSAPYYENVVVDKSIYLIGEDKNTTIVYGSCSEFVFSIIVDWVNITGFAIQGGGNIGIDISSNHNTITGNNISNHYFGIYSYDPYGDPRCNNIITENIISYNGDGIYIEYPSENNIIKENKIISNSRYGIYLGYSSNNDISGNSIFNDGLFVASYSYDNIVKNNTVNGKPLVYLEDEKDKIIDYEAGQVILLNCDNIVVENLNLSNTSVGIQLLGAYNSTIKNNNCSNNYYGIYSYGSSNNKITVNKIISNERYGMYLSSFDDNIISDNNISSNKYSGLYVWGSDRNNITGNKIISNEGSGIYLVYSSYNNITGNKITNNTNGICPLDSDRNKITSNIITNNSKGLYIFNSDKNDITDNIIVANIKYGIHVYCYCKNNNITGNEISNNYFGINLDYNSNSHIIINNNITKNKYGILPSNNNIIKGNIISNNEFGMRMSGSDNNDISGNSFFNDGISSGYSYDNIVKNNTVNGKPLVYLEDEKDKIIDYEAGQVILINCDNIIVENLDISNTLYDIQLFRTHNSKIRNNNLSNSKLGIYLLYSNSNNITDNNIISNNENGIYLKDCSGSTLSDNNIISNNRYGILLDDSSDNIILGNTISNNKDGIHIISLSCNNSIYHNNFLDNNNYNAYDKGNNIWDDGKYGNYWSDYKKRYPDAKKLPLKGVWDTPYDIKSGENKDNYPLIKKWSDSRTRTVTRSQTTVHQILNWFFDLFPNLFPIFRQLLGLV